MNWLSKLKGKGKGEWFAIHRSDNVIDNFMFCDRIKRAQFRMHPNGICGVSEGCITFERKTDFDYVRRLILSFGKQAVQVGGISLETYGVVNVHG